MTTPSAPRVKYFRTLPGRLLILSSVLWLAVIITRLFVDLPPLAEAFRKVVVLAWVIAAISLAVMGIAQNRRRFLWRVRQKLILSYVFLGFVPVLLVVALVFAGGLILYLNLAGYMFHEGLSNVTEDVIQAAETTAEEVGRSPGLAEAILTRKVDNLSVRYPSLSLAVIAMNPAGSNGRPVTAPSASAGLWRHTRAPAEAPSWLAGSAAGFRGTIALPPIEPTGEWTLVIRAVVPTRDHQRAVVADLPIDARVVTDIEAEAKTRMGAVTVPAKCGGPDVPAPVSENRGLGDLFRHSVGFVECSSWVTGDTSAATVAIQAPVGKLYSRVVGLQSSSFNTSISVVLFALAALFLIIQGAALVMGALLSRSITYAVHELFVGTERVQQGDFSHRIRIDSGDQLGDLAVSFNRMSSTIEHSLHVQREKQRLEDELRIAREIQKSLLPTAPPVVPGMTIADLCEPAREVGGDYYDFFDLGGRKTGVMVADVSGKGTSAALYMAELKGMMLALTKKELSPRKLLVEANQLLAEHLDNRSFITMTYAIIDLEARTLTCARAGHTPLIVVSGGRSEVIIPSGMVLGLRLPGAARRFEEVLEEHTRPIQAGDAIVLYTDGITEAMNEAGDLFSDEALAATIVGQHELDAAGIRERVVRDVRTFVGVAEPHDDMTMIVMKVDA